MSTLSEFEFHGWKFLVDTDTTANAYAASARGGAERCTCDYCRNLVACREREYPDELVAFLRRVGVNPFMEAEVWEARPLENGTSFNTGWWHFVGSVVAEGDDEIQLPPNPGGRSREWTVRFRPNQGDMRLETLPDSASLIRVDFFAQLPWVLSTPYPE